MDLRYGDRLPVVRPSREKVVKGAKVQEGGMWWLPREKFVIESPDRYTLLSSGETFDLLEQLKACCLHDIHGVCSAFANLVRTVPVRYEVGRIVRIDFRGLNVSQFSDEFQLIAHDRFTAISGDVERHECVFPYVQYSDKNSINLSCAAFHTCPLEFTPEVYHTFYFAAPPKTPFDGIIFRAVQELSQSHANNSIIFLFAAVEAMTAILSGQNDGKISSRMHNFAKSIACIDKDASQLVQSLKKKIENRVVRQRGIVAHQGQSVSAKDLLPSFEVALEFCWHFDRLSKLST